ncbi:BTAD domain-containing putative transcriptional regulator [Spirillospora sp. CA-294931]|uniref:BTAD domain-containing putative transcriptional regulator n=1 Tax=Spirillospora sp. CA-294931 TaxID=3240042 RepID=UPI003D8BC16E
MRFGVLGPLEVRTGEGKPVRVPETKVRALLADLLVHRGRTVPADRLIDDLWGTAPPANASATLRAKVSQLRRALDEAEPGARELVTFQAPGYALTAEDVDADRFQDLLERAGRQDGDPRAKAALLREALGLWRGPAYADFEEFTRDEARRLEERRLVALEDLAETRLELGEHGVLAGELAALVDAHPLRERLRAVHVRALYRAGRQGEALAGLAELRDRLRDELGVDPGPELAALHRAILRQDPALDAGTRPRTNLPAQLTELIGREEAVRLVRGLLASERLVTLTGAGGVGKTRLALEAAFRQIDAFPDGVWVVELAGRARPGAPAAEVVEAVAAVVGVRDEAAVEPVRLVDRLTEAIGARRMLLVLDNCEHVIDSAAELAGTLLRAVPGLRILATSQEPLAIGGEHVWTVPPLDLPDGGDLERSPAVRLFTARAAAATPGFALDAGNADAVASICRRLDGMPLALELAATRVRVMGVRELADRLDDRFRVLTASPRGVPARQRTLRAMIDWSWELLTEAERVVLRRLSVHAGGCTLRAAERVCSGGDVRPADVLDLLGRLVERSLVVLSDGPAGARYGMLESVAAYSRDRLREAGEEDAFRDRHLAYHVALAEEAAPDLRGRGQCLALERLDGESANLRAALDTAAARDPASALRLVNALAWYWYLRGRFHEARRSLTQALSAGAGGPGRAAALAWRAGMSLLVLDGADGDPVKQSEDALEQYERAGDPAGLARARWFVGLCRLGFGDTGAALGLVDRALDGFAELDDRWGLAAALKVRAEAAMTSGDFAAVRRDGERSMAIFREIGDMWGELQASYVLGELAEATGDYRQAETHRAEGLRIAEYLGLWHEVSNMLARLGRIALLTGDDDRADELHRRARRIAASRSYPRGEHFAETGLALLARRQGRLDDAEAHLRAWLEWCRRWDGAAGLAFLLAELGFVAEQRGDAEAAQALAVEAMDHARQVGDRRALALACEGLAGARNAAGHAEDAARLLGTAHALRASVGAPLPPAERGDVDRITSAARRALGDATFETAFLLGTRSSTAAPGGARAAV